MMAARRIGFTMLKTPASETSPVAICRCRCHCRSWYGCPSPWSDIDPTFLPFKVLFIGVNLVKQALQVPPGLLNCFSFYGQSKYQIKFALHRLLFEFQGSFLLPSHFHPSLIFDAPLHG